MHNTQGKEGPVMVVYDIRGIQDFVFRTNRVKDIIGASDIVAKVLTESIQEWFEKQDDVNAFRFNWLDKKGKPKEFAFCQKGSCIQAELLYIGGGNAYVAYRNNQLAEDANRFIARSVLRNTHSLSLASASVYMTDNYLEDQKKLMQRMARIKAEGRMARPVAGFPFTKEELGTGLPCTVYGQSDGERISTETLYKRQRYEQLKENEKGPFFALEFDKMIEEKGRNSILAVVHLDGNSMGSGIQKRMQSCKSYENGVLQMRRLSLNITQAFEKVGFDAMVKLLECKGFPTHDPNQPLPMRPIIRAGDDLTFICRASLALDLVQACLNAVSTRTMDGETQQGEGFSACAGIVFVNSHFPFSQSYALAEELCGLAKKKAKSTAKSTDSRVGSYVDFHICYSGNTDDIESLREKEYVSREGKPLLRRPYCADPQGSVDDPDHIASLKAQLAHLDSNVPRSYIKRARDAYHQAEHEVDLVFAKAASLVGRSLTPDEKKQPFDQSGRATLFDALEMFDIFGSSIIDGHMEETTREADFKN